jgi:DNA repair exonuclease SbcCD ATPase subunit
MTEPDERAPGPDGDRSSPGLRDADEIRRHEAHLVGQIYHLIEANHRLEEQLHRLGKVTEIADLFRRERITRDTFELKPPHLLVPVQADNAWRHIDESLARLESGISDAASGNGDADGVTALKGSLEELRDSLGVVRESAWHVDPDWQADVRGRLVAAEQAVAYLNEQSRELDLLRREKDSIMDGATRLEQNMEDLWKALNEKTTHIQRLEAQLSQIWASLPYRVYKAFRRPFRKGGRP